MLIAGEVLAQTEIQVIPYKVNNFLGNLSINTGREYAKLVSLASAIKKDIIIYPHGKTAETLKKLSSLNRAITIRESRLLIFLSLITITNYNRKKLDLN